MFERFTEKAIKVIMLAQEEARRLGHNFVGTEQMLLGLIGEGSGIGSTVLNEYGATLRKARIEIEKIIGRGSGFVSVEIPFTPRAKRVLELSLQEAIRLNHAYIGTEHLLLGLINEGEGVGMRILRELDVDLEKVKVSVIRLMANSEEAVPAGTPANSKTPTLTEYGRDLTQRAEDGELDPVVGRAKEIERVIQILGRRTKNNPILIGEPGVGKTAVAEGLAQRIVQHDIPDTLEERKVVSLDMSLLVAGTKYRGEFEERLKKIMEEIKQTEKIILVIDEVHTLIGAGAAEGAMDAANILKPALSRGEIQCIGATTLTEYRKHIEKDAALERRFQPVQVDEPSVMETIEILGGLRDRYEFHHKLKISDDALSSAAFLSNQYIADRFLPDKAIDLIDEAASRLRLTQCALPKAAKDLDKEWKDLLQAKEAAIRAQHFEEAAKLRDKEKEIKTQIAAIAKNAQDAVDREGAYANLQVGSEDVADIVATWTGIPVNRLNESEASKLAAMEQMLHTKIIGQEDAVEAVSKAIRRARVGLKNPDRPIASFVFAGPTGVGKTELTKALANYFFGSVDTMIRLDMSEYMERHTVAKLIGSPPGYVGYNDGGQLTDTIRRRPFSLILFDEIEKAHPDVFNLMLQILDDGRLTDAKGRTVSFKNTLIILTSNLGAKAIQSGKNNALGFDFSEAAADTAYSNLRKTVLEAFKGFFRPEFLNRLDEIIIFRQLTKDEISQVAELMLEDISKRTEEKEIKLDITKRFKETLISKGYNPTYGARPLRRVLIRMLEDVLATDIIEKKIKPGDEVLVDVSPDEKTSISIKSRRVIEDDEVVSLVKS